MTQNRRASVNIITSSGHKVKVASDYVNKSLKVVPTNDGVILIMEGQVVVGAYTKPEALWTVWEDVSSPVADTDTEKSNESND